MDKQIYDRVFLALIPPEEVQEKLLEKIHHLKSGNNLTGVKWYAKEKLHVTLQFLGKITADEFHMLLPQLTTALKSYTALDITLGDIVVFPGLRHPKVIAAEVLASPTLFSLVATISKIIEACSLSKPDFPFNGHLTLGRLPHSSYSFDSKIVEVTPELQWSTNTVYLMDSVLKNNTSTYVKLAEFKCAS